jgi:hypothetical protein
VAEAEPRAAGAPCPCLPAQRGEFAEIAAGFAVGVATAWRYVEETMALLAGPRAPKLRRAVCDAKWAGYAYVTLDGTLIPIDRVAADRPFYSGKHKKHGMNLQVIASPGGDVLWASGRCPGRSTARRPSGPGACWPSWSPRAWSPWPIRDTGAAAGRRSRTGGGTSPGRVPEFRESSRSSLANRPQLSNLAGQLKFRASSTSIGTP